jgi:hypothetical protein
VDNIKMDLGEIGLDGVELSLRKPTRGQIQRGILVVNERGYVR